MRKGGFSFVLGWAGLSPNDMNADSRQKPVCGAKNLPRFKPDGNGHIWYKQEKQSHGNANDNTEKFNNSHKHFYLLLGLYYFTTCFETSPNTSSILDISTYINFVNFLIY